MSLVQQLVVFCDGTNNTLTGHRTDTNVLRLNEQLTRGLDTDGAQQLYYDPGVGVPGGMPGIDLLERASRQWERVTGLVMGSGIYDNIAQAYLFLCQHWQPGVDIYIFGFSRGAFTARCVAGMVNLFGLIRPEQEVLMPILLRVYFSPESEGGDGIELSAVRAHEAAKAVQTGSPDENDRHSLAEQIRASAAGGARAQARVHFVGVWDTVAAVGVWPFTLRISAKAVITGKRMDHVRHALSLDEHRMAFEPRLYSQPNAGTPQDAQSLKQCWFRGVHSDVGGGYAINQSGLANDALDWMVGEAIACGLRCEPYADWSSPPGGTPNTEYRRHDALYGDGAGPAWWALAGMTLRDTLNARGDDGGKIPIPPVAAAQLAVANPPGSVWDQRRGARQLLLFAALTLLLGVLAGASMVTEDWQLFCSSTWPSPGVLVRALLGFSLDPVAVSWGFGHVLLALLLNAGFIVAFAATLSRPASRTYMRMAGVRNIGDPLPRRRWFGFSLPLLIAGQGAAVLSTLLARWVTPATPLLRCGNCTMLLDVIESWAAVLLLGLSDLMRLIAATALLGVLLLVLIGGLGTGRLKR